MEKVFVAASHYINKQYQRNIIKVNPATSVDRKNIGS